MNFLVDSSCRAAHVTDMDTFYHNATDVFKWGSLENSTVMDIGCGLGLSSMKLLKLFPDIRKIVGIDNDVDVVLEARELFPDDKIRFYYGNIELGDGLHMYKNKVSAIFCTHCLCYVQNQKAAFQNMYDLLEDGGVAALLFFRKSKYKDYIMMLKNDPMLPSFLSGRKGNFPEFSVNRYTPHQYEDILKEIGFRIEKCEEVVKCREYASIELYKEYILSSIYLKENVSMKAYGAYKEDLIDIYMTYYSEMSDRNLPCFKDLYLQVFLSKPPKCNASELSLIFETRININEEDEVEIPYQNVAKEEQSCSEDENVRFHYR